MAATLLQITAPCGACSRDVRFGEPVCPACGAKVSRAVKQALDHRLAAADPAFRGLVNNVWSASLVLLLVAVAHLGLALFRYYLAHDPGLAPAFSDRTAARAELVADLAVSATMVGCFLWARRSPLVALTVALVVWCSIQSLTLSLGGLELFSLRIIVTKIGLLAVMVRGIVSGLIARRLRARLAPPRPAALPVARVRARR